MVDMKHKEQPSAARKFKVMEIMGNEFQEGKSPHSYTDLMAIKDLAVAALEEYYGARAVKNTFYAICKEKGWETKPAPTPKPEKNGLGARMDQIDSRVSSGEAAVLELGKRLRNLEDLVSVADGSLTARIAILEGGKTLVKKLNRDE